jgi:hypothetical protein
MVNSVQRLQETKAFVRMASGIDLKKYGWYGDGTNGNGHTTELLASMPGIVQDPNGAVRFTEWNCRAGQNNVIIRTDGTVAPCFPMYSSSFDWGNIDEPKFVQHHRAMKKTCQRHCFSTLNHNLAYCYNDAGHQVGVGESVTNRRGDNPRSFED